MVTGYETPVDSDTKLDVNTNTKVASVEALKRRSVPLHVNG
jgi:hypothetical protein